MKVGIANWRNTRHTLAGVIGVNFLIIGSQTIWNARLASFTRVEGIHGLGTSSTREASARNASTRLAGV